MLPACPYQVMLQLKKLDLFSSFVSTICANSLKVPLVEDFDILVEGWVMRGDHVIRYGTIKYTKAKSRPTIKFKDCELNRHKYLLCA